MFPTSLAPSLCLFFVFVQLCVLKGTVVRALGFHCFFLFLSFMCYHWFRPEHGYVYYQLEAALVVVLFCPIPPLFW